MRGILTASLVVTGDIGGLKGYHVGDEAMFAANLAHLRRINPGVQLTAISRDPQWTAAHYNVAAIPTIGFSAEAGLAGDADRESLWHDLSGSEAAARIREAIANSDGLVIPVGEICGLSGQPTSMIDAH